MDDWDDLDLIDEVPDEVPDEDEDEPVSTCHWCGAAFAGNDVGHCTGGKYGGCCQNFASDHAFTKHRTGKYEPNTRRCLTTDELIAKGWVKTGAYGSWRTPPPANNPWKEKA